MSHELIITARRLANVNIRRPRQADLRKAVSTAYYALFHVLAQDCADQAHRDWSAHSGFGGGCTDGIGLELTMNTQELMAEAILLPVEERVLVVDALLKSLNPTETASDERWAVIAQHRLEQLRSGQVTAIPGEAVFAHIARRLGT